MFRTWKNSLRKYIGATLLRWKIKFSIDGYSSIQGWLSPAEAYYLYYFASKIPGSGIVVEIGSWKGKSTYCLAKGLKKGEIFAIDPFIIAGEEESLATYNRLKGQESLFTQFSDNMRRLNVFDKVTPLVGYSRDFVNNFDRIDLLFIDGDHSIEESLFDYQHFANKIKGNGFLLIHDYYPHRKAFGPTQLIEAYIRPSGLFAEIGIYDSLWVGKKKNEK